MIHINKGNSGNDHIVLNISLKCFFDIFNINFYVREILMEYFCKFWIDLYRGKLIGVFNTFKDCVCDNSCASAEF